MSEQAGIDEGFIPRTLWHETEQGQNNFSQDQLIGQLRPIVVLGEAGMGKSHLLRWLTRHIDNTAFCTARQLINRPNPQSILGNASALIIDALDEISTQREGDAVDQVLGKLGQLDYPHFILSCRVADWRSATGMEAIREQYAQSPLVLHLNPFSDDDALDFLRASLGEELAKRIIEHLNARGLEGFLGNPHTLELIAKVAASGNIPDTRSELYQQAVEILRFKHDHRTEYDQPSREDGLNAAGAAFASLILTGNEALTKASSSYLDDGDLRLVDLSPFTAEDILERMIGTRLFCNTGQDRFTYFHRRVGEYLGAQWLAKKANNRRKRRRLLALFHSHGLVPANLRGIHAWLARDANLAQEVIAADPMGVIEYGDADDLTINQAKWLLEALKQLAEQNPRFKGWETYSTRGITDTALLPDIQFLITDSNTPFQLRSLMLEAIKGTEVATMLATELYSISLDNQAYYSIRSDAIDALLALSTPPDWTELLQAFRAYGDEDSIRLALQLLREIDWDQIDEGLVVDLMIAWAKLEGRTVGVMMGLERNIPSSKVDSILDRLSDAAITLGETYSRPGNDTLTDFVYQLIERRITWGSIDAKRLWSWLEPFEKSFGFQKEARKQLAAYVEENHEFRRALQKHVLLDLAGEHNAWHQAWQLNERIGGSWPSPEDTIVLLKELDPEDRSDERWRDVVQLARKEGIVDADVRMSAYPFAAHSPEHLAWLEELAILRKPDWEIRQEKRDRRRLLKQSVRYAEHRKQYQGEITKVRSGVFGWVIGPAQAYLKLFNDIDEELPPRGRISSWLGEEVTTAALEGFEKFLQHESPEPSSIDVAKAIAKREHYNACLIIVAALAERFVTEIGFTDVSDERLLTGMLELRFRQLDDHAGISGLSEAVEAEIAKRGLWETAIRLHIEPQLQNRCDHVDGLYALMRDKAHPELSIKLATEWLQRFPGLPTDPELELIDRLLRADRQEEIRRIAKYRANLSDDSRRRTWDGIGLIVDFTQTKKRLETFPVEPELLWHVRERMGGGFQNAESPPLTTDQLEWLIKAFRPLWPLVSHPNGGWSGDTNPWDASDFILKLVHRLGKTPSSEARDALLRINGNPADKYSESIKAITAEQAQLRVEASHTPPSLEAVNAITNDLAPQSASDLQTVVFEELLVAQAKVTSDDVDSWRRFYDNNLPLAEEPCRDRLIGMLREGSQEISYEPETHVADDKEVDIACSIGQQLRMPIEVKGQWHPDVWNAVETQLDRYYTQDWRAEGRGIYLVLWFGEQGQPNKRLRSPGRGLIKPQTAKKMQEMLVSRSAAAREGRVKILVLDLVHGNRN